MKKLLSKICLSLMGLVLSLVLFMPNFSNYANAENNSNENVVNEKYTLIGADFNKGDSLSKYNIQSSNISSFTPFNLKEGKRLSGNSFALTKGERNQILDQVVFVDSVEVPKQDNSLYIWINFDTVYLHNLKVTLELENEATLVWDLNSEILVDLVRKTEIATVLALPYSWNQLELPFNLASVTGTIYNGDKLVSAKSIKINFTSEKKQGQGSEGEDVDVEEELKITYSTLLFYDIYISKSSNTEQYSVDKQNYRFYKIIGYSEDFLNSICVGDTISLPTNFKAVVEYAWNGYDDLRNGNLNTVLWRIVVKTPNPKGEYLYPDFGSKLTFEQEGTYEIFYQCVDTKHSNSQPIISDSVKINVRALQDRKSVV